MKAVGGWLLFAVVVFGLFNAGSSEDAIPPGAPRPNQAGFHLTPELALRSVRSYLNSDSDFRRYFAYCNAALGRPYASFYVRTAAQWQRSFTAQTTPEPASFPVVQPPYPLLPYRDFLVEYPPGFFLFALPVAELSPDFESFQLLFASLMGLLLIVSVVICQSLARQLFGNQAEDKAFASRTAVCVLLLGTMVTHRYDASVALLLSGMCWAGMRRRPALFGLLLGLAVATKLTPLLCAPPWVLLWLHRRRFRELAIATATGLITLAAACLPALLGAGHALLDVVTYHRDRPLQIESTAGALFALLGGRAVAMVHTFGSTNLTGPHLQGLLSLTTVAGVAGFLFIYGSTWQSLNRLAVKASAERTDYPVAEGRLVIAATAATLVIFMVTGKVFSPQYLVWLLPLAVLLASGDRQALTLLLLLCALTQLIYPICYGLLTDLNPAILLLDLTRNCLLLAWGWHVWQRASRRPSAP